MARIYTRSGDQGETGLIGGRRTSKAHDRIEAIGAVDETNAAIGVVRAASGPPEPGDFFEWIQNRLFAVGSALASPTGTVEGVPEVGEEDVSRIESEIDRLEQALPPLRNFILPGGTEAAAFAHLARTVCRRAERAVVRLQNSGDVPAGAVTFLNRLSDYLFVLARTLNHRVGVKEAEWRPKSE